MIYRYSLKPTAENVDFGTRTINGVNLHVGHWSYSDTPLSFKGFESSVIEERANSKEEFNDPKPVATRVVDQEPTVVPTPIHKIETNHPEVSQPMIDEPDLLPPKLSISKKREATNIVVHTDKQLRTHLMTRGFSLTELITYSHAQLYELLLLDRVVKPTEPLEGDHNGR
jgi:hypothetical protein